MRHVYTHIEVADGLMKQQPVTTPLHLANRVNNTASVDVNVVLLNSSHGQFQLVRLNFSQLCKGIILLLCGILCSFWIEQPSRWWSVLADAMHILSTITEVRIRFHENNIKISRLKKGLITGKIKGVNKITAKGQIWHTIYADSSWNLFFFPYLVICEGGRRVCWKQQK
eukprot:GHVO01063079.1.p1 GENE.GHVO01063079.1~~GHVO01063079.1.p1  ORF type:complete len:169 (+),score=4.79 GHVO01063079.1:1284-1790(+)